MPRAGQDPPVRRVSPGQSTGRNDPGLYDYPRDLRRRRRTTTWLIPKLVGEVKFTEWTSENEMRHPVFLGLRTDKKAIDVIREKHENNWPMSRL